MTTQSTCSASPAATSATPASILLSSAPPVGLDPADQWTHLPSPAPALLASMRCRTRLHALPVGLSVLHAHRLPPIVSPAQSTKSPTVSTRAATTSVPARMAISMTSNPPTAKSAATSAPSASKILTSAPTATFSEPSGRISVDLPPSLVPASLAFTTQERLPARGVGTTAQRVSILLILVQAAIHWAPTVSMTHLTLNHVPALLAISMMATAGYVVSVAIPVRAVCKTPVTVSNAQGWVEP
jgi:hypothetical protein